MFSKKKYIFRTTILLFWLCLIPSFIYAQNVISDLEEGFLKSNPALIVKHFNENTKLIILDDYYLPDKEEAISLLTSFFKSNKAVSFEEKFDSEKRNSNFIIKILRTPKKGFPCYHFFQKYR